MEKLVIERTRPLQGTLTVNGAKNSVLPIMAACLLTDEPSVIEHVPMVTDVATMGEILKQLGVQVALSGSRMQMHPDGFKGTMAPYELVSKMRASVCLLGPLLARQGKASVSLPGGCVIGPRPVDLHLRGLEALGAAIAFEHGYIVATAPRLRGARVHLGGAFGSSVLATGNVMMAAALAAGTTVIEHAACEPEVVDLADFLVSMGARIEGHGGPVVRIEGVERLRGSRYRIISDRIEAGTLMMAAAITGGQVRLEHVRVEHLATVVDKLREAGVRIETGSNSVQARASAPLRAVDVTTLPYPGFPTDLQAQMMALMSVASGTSVVTEKVYPERFLHVPELTRMGASITREGATAIIKGVHELSGAQVVASDLRASAALVLAGLAANNHTEVRGLEHLDRGYQNLEWQLSELGASMQRVPEEAAVRASEALPKAPAKRVRVRKKEPTWS
jgi:UDP-N-acetylglucosamine 1-carboxyvinyltransferase